MNRPIVTASPAAARFLADRRYARGPQVLVITCWSSPGVVTVHDALAFRPGIAHEEVGEVAGCRAYANVDGCRISPHDRLIIEVRRNTAGAPALIARGESEGERQDRVLRTWVGAPSGSRS